ncbi:competence protein ComK [Sporosarcina thermotolerans]|uniref:Competence protein ComK n=1 Tax=Sporosarcina thermotolerans TaxID=633404 RepID=A0AAW9A5A1_9BACL|nr:competence protein ComK [Sporosarcina thermotolerans]MDW0116064.1 competence protein ComK [Sporosarcina thermotolerans]WHT48035.1 competence protein ComK [Sporosarcina thermotolerans]
MYCKSVSLDKDALALRWANSNGSVSEIITPEGIFLSEQTPLELLGHSQKKGTPLQGGFYPANGQTTNRAFIQTAASNTGDCVWILSDCFTLKAVEKNRTKVYFKNGISITVGVSKEFMDRKRLRIHRYSQSTYHLNYILPGIKEFNQKYF